MNQIEIYSTDNCPWCTRAKSLLRAKGLDFEEIDISSDQARALEMIERSGRRTVPQIFIGDRHIGGYTDLAELDMEDELEPLLNA